MSIWSNCKADTIYYGKDTANVDEACEVFVQGDEIVVSYEDEDGLVKYVGKENGAGHYELRSMERNGHATLHRFAEGKIMEGFWEEDGERGMWRIRLIE